LAAILPALALVLSACGGSPTAAPTAADTDIGEPSTSVAPEEPAVADLGGRVIVVGTDASYPPFESMDQNNEVVGIDPDLMAAICSIANCVAEFQNTAWDGIFGALASGDFDVLMSAITILPEREEESGARFTDPYFQVGQVVLTRADNTTINSAEDLTGPDVQIGVQTGTTGDTAAGELGVPESAMSRFETIVLAVEALLNGDVDAVVVDNPTADVYRARHPDLRVAGQPFTTEDYGILVPEDEEEVLTAFNAAIAELLAAGTVDEIVSRWYAAETASQ
jgi:polar amino acid transport system substrate-binding protein